MKKIVLIFCLSSLSLTSGEVKKKPVFIENPHYEWRADERKIHKITKTNSEKKDGGSSIVTSEVIDQVLNIKIPEELNMVTEKNSYDSPDLETLLVRKGTLEKYIPAKINYFSWYTFYKNTYRYNDEINAIERVGSIKDIKETIISNMIVFIIGIILFLLVRTSTIFYMKADPDRDYILFAIGGLMCLLFSFLDRNTHFEFTYLTNLATLSGLAAGFVITRWYKNRQKKKALKEKPV